VADTLVLMGDGSRKHIDEIKVGDYVLSVNEHDLPSDDIGRSSTSVEHRYTKRVSAPKPQRVTHIFVHENRQVFQLVIDEEVFDTTSVHRFFVVNHGWTPAAEIAVGDIVISADGTHRTVGEKQYLTTPATVYNLEVEESHTFFVGESDVWVHNIKLQQ